MTVSEIVNVLKDAKQVNLSWNGTLHEMVLEDPFMANAFADNIVSAVYAVDDGCFEIALAVRPLKRGEVV